MGEMKASWAFGHITEVEYGRRWAHWRDNVKEEWVADMDAHTDTYVELLQEYASRSEDSVVLLERTVHTGIEGCWGTADAIVIVGTHAYVVDLKYGQGIPVVSENNSQLMLYGLGVLEDYGVVYDFDTVTMVVFQPRMGATSHSTMSAEDLLEWRQQIKPIAESALEDDAELIPSEDACRFCPAAGICKVRMNKMLAEDFGDPEIMTPEDTALALSKLKDIKKWCAAVEVARWS